MEAGEKAPPETDDAEESVPKDQYGNELTDFEKSLDTEKYGYQPSIFHIALPFAALSYHY